LKREAQQREEHGEDEQVAPEFQKTRATQDDRPHQFDEIRRGQQRAEGVKDPRHRLAGREDNKLRCAVQP
jgi:hypothetical protein